MDILSRIKYEIKICSLKNRLSEFLPTSILHIFEDRYDGSLIIEDNDDCMKQVISFVDIMQDNFDFEELFINIPIATLDFDELVM